MRSWGGGGGGAVSKKNNVSLTVLASVSANGNVARMNQIIYCCNINSGITSAIRGHLSDTVGCINFTGKSAMKLEDSMLLDGVDGGPIYRKKRCT